MSKIQYLKNDQLPVMLSGWKGNPFLENEFQYIGKPFRPEFSKVFKMMFSPNPQRQEKKNDKWKPIVRKGTTHLYTDQDFIVWLGHATFLMQLDGVRLITDPVFFNLAILKRLIPLPFDLSEMRDIDYVLLSHDHRDHCDQQSLQTILSNNQPEILTSLKMTDVIGDWANGLPMQEAGWFQTYRTKNQDLRITYLPAQHWCRRGLTDFNRRLWGSFMIETNHHTIYFGADSASGDHFRQIGELFPNIDIAILGIGAYSPDYMMKENHANPEEAFEAFQQLGAKKMIPMHHGTYDLSNEPIGEPARWLTSCFQKKDIAEQLILPDVNELISLS